MTDNKVSLSVNPGGSITAETPVVGGGGIDDTFRTNNSSSSGNSAPSFPRLSTENSLNNSNNCTGTSSPQLGGRSINSEGSSTPAQAKMPSPNVISNSTGPHGGGSNSIPPSPHQAHAQPTFQHPQNGNGIHHPPPPQLESTTIGSQQSQPALKKTSFQITSVTTIDSSNSNDGGDESGDDLDESHTEDSSDIPSGKSINQFNFNLNLEILIKISIFQNTFISLDSYFLLSVPTSNIHQQGWDSLFFLMK